LGLGPPQASVSLQQPPPAWRRRRKREGRRICLPLDFVLDSGKLQVEEAGGPPAHSGSGQGHMLHRWRRRGEITGGDPDCWERIGSGQREEGLGL
jgi:hypothetical protein